MIARLAMLLAVLGGLAAAAWAIGTAGLHDVLQVVARMGPGGFALYCLWSVGVFGVLGAAWGAAAEEDGRWRCGLFGWARMVREAAADLLPFSQIGGIVIAARTLTVAGIATTRAYASLVVDLTTELASQVVFTAAALLLATRLLGAGARGVAPWPTLATATGGLLLVTTMLVVGQHAGLRLARRIAGAMLPRTAVALTGIEADLRGLYREGRRVALAFLLNLAAWVLSAAGAWLALQLMAVAVRLDIVLALEACIFLVRSVAFLVPGGLGAQEAAYLVLGPAFGLPADAAIALALAKRGRDVTLGVGTLLVWQALERRLVPGRPPWPNLGRRERARPRRLASMETTPPKP